MSGVLDAESRELLEVFARDGVRPYDQMSVLQARAVVAGATRLQGPREHVEQVSDVLIDLGPGRMSARLYHPDPAGVLPLVVYLHGGGFVAGSVAVADRPCRALAIAAGCAVLSVEYRLAPENPFPVPIFDCLTAIRWVVDHASQHGLDASRVVVMGDSAGGALAASCALALRDAGDSPLIGQVLLYPTLRPTRGNPSASLQTNGEGYSMTRGSLEWFWEHYLAGSADGVNPLAAPLLARDFDGLPPTTVIVAEFDPLRDEGLDYARRLQDAGVPTRVHLIPGGLHGLWWMDKVLGQARELTGYLAADLRLRFGQ